MPLPEKYYQYIERFGDIRFVGQAVFVVLVLMISYSGVKVIHTNYQLQQQISTMQQQNEIQKLQNENQKLKNEYYDSSQYLELSARENFGLAAPGEKELIVPKEVAMAYVPKDTASGGSNTQTSKQPFYVRNIEAWFNFFLHRQTVSS